MRVGDCYCRTSPACLLRKLGTADLAITVLLARVVIWRSSLLFIRPHYHYHPHLRISSPLDRCRGIPCSQCFNQHIAEDGPWTSHKLKIELELQLSTRTQLRGKQQRGSNVFTATTTFTASQTSSICTPLLSHLSFQEDTLRAARRSRRLISRSFAGLQSLSSMSSARHPLRRLGRRSQAQTTHQPCLISQATSRAFLQLQSRPLFGSASTIRPSQPRCSPSQRSLASSAFPIKPS